MKMISSRKIRCGKSSLTCATRASQTLTCFSKRYATSSGGTVGLICDRAFACTARTSQLLHLPLVSLAFPISHVSHSPTPSRYINTTCPTVREDTPFERAYTLFRTLGLRHLVVLGAPPKVSAALGSEDNNKRAAVSRERDVMGVVTRWDLTTHHAKAAIAQRRRVVTAALRRADAADAAGTEDVKQRSQTMQ